MDRGNVFEKIEHQEAIVDRLKVKFEIVQKEEAKFDAEPNH